MTELLAPCVLLCDVVPDPAVFWAMVGALGTWVAAILAGLVVIVIIYEARSFRREQAAHTAAGVDWLFQYLNREKILRTVDAFERAIEIGRNDTAFSALRDLLADVDIVRELIEEKFVTARMLHLLTGPRYYDVNNGIDQLQDDPEARERTRQIIAFRPEAYELIQEIASQVEETADRAERWMEQNP